MSYYNGTVASLNDLLTALTSACTTEGWTYSGGEFVKHGCYFPVSVDTYVSPYTRLRMQIKNPLDSTLSEITSIRDTSNFPISFPAEYHIFAFDKEVYCVLNIQPGLYCWINFGASSVIVPGSGAFLSGTSGGGWGTSTSIDYGYPVFFFRTSENGTTVNQSSRMDVGLPGCLPFSADGSNGGAGFGAFDWYAGTNSIGTTQPNNFSGESILTPLQIWADHTGGKQCLVYQSEHARHVRIDNYEDEQIITYGPDKWMIFPWRKRNTGARSVVYRADSSSGTGTFGIAIRYEGP